MVRQGELVRHRNIGLMAHIDAGKTPTSGRIFFYTGVSHWLGEVHDGTAIMDWMEQDQERGITITSATTACFWKDHSINIIDTSGYVDFTIEVERSLRVLDGVIAVFCAVGGGVQHQFETVWCQADRYGVSRVAFINKMDRTGADHARYVEMMANRLSCRPVFLQLPIGSEDSFQGVVDLLTRKAMRFDDANKGMNVLAEEIPADMVEAVEAARLALVETACEFNDALMERYLGGEELKVVEIKAGLRAGVLQNAIVPVLLGSAFKNKGSQPLLDAVLDYLPSSPVDEASAIAARTDKGQEVELRSNPREPFAVMAFKLMNDLYVGSLTFLRVYSGKFCSSDTLVNSSHDRKERIGRLLRMHANQREEMSRRRSTPATSWLRWGSRTPSPAIASVRPSGRWRSRPCTSLSWLRLPIRPVRKPLDEKLGQGLHRLMAEDPSFWVEHDEQTNQTVIKGIGELHGEIIVNCLRREFKVAAEVAAPQVAYREAITKPAAAEGRYVEQTGGRGQYGHCKIEIAPGELGSGIIFEDKIVGGVIPREYVPAVEKDVKDACAKDVLVGFLLVDVTTSFLDGSYHEVDSDEQAFFIVGSMALKDAAKAAGLGLLEPTMKPEVTTPDDYLGNVMGDLSSRRGHVQGMDTRPGVQVVTALEPLAVMFSYATYLRSFTQQGRATFSMELSHYEPLPVSLAQEVIEKVCTEREARSPGAWRPSF